MYHITLTCARAVKIIRRTHSEHTRNGGADRRAHRQFIFICAAIAGAVHHYTVAYYGAHVLGKSATVTDAMSGSCAAALRPPDTHTHARTHRDWPEWRSKDGRQRSRSAAHRARGGTGRGGWRGVCCRINHASAERCAQRVRSRVYVCVCVCVSVSPCAFFVEHPQFSVDYHCFQHIVLTVHYATTFITNVRTILHSSKNGSRDKKCAVRSQSHADPFAVYYTDWQL